MKIVAISDTHNRHNKITIPQCDILLHAGDESMMGRESEIRNFARWLNKQPAKYIVWTPGNHSVDFESSYPESIKWIKEECPRAHVLVHESIVIEGIKIFASPWSPWFFDWSYNAGRTIEEATLRNIPFIGDLWKDIPDDIDILMTHGPAYGILDEVLRIDGSPSGRRVGCEELLKVIQKNKVPIHIAGHIHCGFGQAHIDGTSFYNVACCDEMYYPSNGITIIDYEKETK